MDKATKISLHCVFCCSSQFEMPHEDYKPQHGEAIKCGNCKKLNDFTSLKKVALEKGKKCAINEAGSIIRNALKNVGKNLK